MTTPNDENDRTTAIGLSRYAEEFLHAAEVLDQSVANDHRYDDFSPVPAYLCAFHSIELSAKAFLRHRGVGAKELRVHPLGHDVGACIKAGRKLGLDQVFVLIPDDETALRLLSDLNAQQGLRYLRTGVKEFPFWGIVWPFTVSFFRAIADEVGWRHSVTVGFSRDVQARELSLDEQIDAWLSSASEADLGPLNGGAATEGGPVVRLNDEGGLIAKFRR